MKTKIEHWNEVYEHNQFQFWLTAIVASAIISLFFWALPPSHSDAPHDKGAGGSTISQEKFKKGLSLYLQNPDAGYKLICESARDGNSDAIDKAHPVVPG
jgi:hypothetical protein